ncbi:MAG: hypothetical protein H0Z39_04350 [Peptococcaceae bacterium]|nr:hypothetical protein [Peptococcaceae bacterium]
MYKLIDPLLSDPDNLAARVGYEYYVYNVVNTALDPNLKAGQATTGCGLCRLSRDGINDDGKNYHIIQKKSYNTSKYVLDSGSRRLSNEAQISKGTCFSGEQFPRYDKG